MLFVCIDTCIPKEETCQEKNAILLTIRANQMEHAKVRRFIKNKTKMITIRINPELLQRLDEVLQKDKQYTSRNDFIEDCILRYLESKRQI
jgi:hypothetical protein